MFNCELLRVRSSTQRMFSPRSLNSTAYFILHRHSMLLFSNNHSIYACIPPSHDMLNTTLVVQHIRAEYSIFRANHLCKVRVRYRRHAVAWPRTRHCIQIVWPVAASGPKKQKGRASRSVYNARCSQRNEVWWPIATF